MTSFNSCRQSTKQLKKKKKLKEKEEEEEEEEEEEKEEEADKEDEEEREERTTLCLDYLVKLSISILSRSLSSWKGKNKVPK